MRGDPRELKRKKQTGKCGFRFILKKIFFINIHTIKQKVLFFFYYLLKI